MSDQTFYNIGPNQTYKTLPTWWKAVSTSISNYTEHVAVLREDFTMTTGLSISDADFTATIGIGISIRSLNVTDKKTITFDTTGLSAAIDLTKNKLGVHFELQDFIVNLATATTDGIIIIGTQASTENFNQQDKVSRIRVTGKRGSGQVGIDLSKVDATIDTCIVDSCGIGVRFVTYDSVIKGHVIDSGAYHNSDIGFHIFAGSTVTMTNLGLIAMDNFDDFIIGNDPAGINLSTFFISSDNLATFAASSLNSQTAFSTYFVSFSGGDYHLTSPAIDLWGIAVNLPTLTPTLDFDGFVRTR